MERLRMPLSIALGFAMAQVVLAVIRAVVT